MHNPMKNNTPKHYKPKRKINGIGITSDTLTSRHLTWFDTLKKEPEYAGTIESDPANLLSSHSVKRFFNIGSYHWRGRGELVYRVNSIEKRGVI